MVPSTEVLDLFAVPAVTAPLEGTCAVLAGDLVLSPGGDPAVQTWSSPVLARLAVSLDESPGRGRRDLRLAMPVPARDGSWVVDGWSAARWEPGTTVCRDLDVVLATGRLLHARLASAVPTAPEVALPSVEGPEAGPSQLVHTALTGSVLLDAAGAPVVLGVAPAWGPVRWAEALAVLDAVVRWGVDPRVLQEWGSAADAEAVARAAWFRAATGGDDARAYAELAPTSPT